MNTKMLSAFLMGIILLAAAVTACASPSTQVPATPTFLALPTSTLFLGTPPTAARIRAKFTAVPWRSQRKPVARSDPNIFPVLIKYRGDDNYLRDR